MSTHLMSAGKKSENWLPLVLLIILFYIPRQTAPGGIFEHYIALRWLSLVIIPPLFIFQFMRSIVRRKNFIFTGVALPLVAFFTWSLVSKFANGTGFSEFFGYVLIYSAYPLLFIAFVNMDISHEMTKKVIYLFIALLILQIPECAYRFLVLGLKGDVISRSLGIWGTFDLGVYMCYAGALMIAAAVIRKITWYHVALMTSFFMIAVFGEIKAFVVAMPIVGSITVYYASKGQKMIKKLFIMIALPIVALLVFYAVFMHWGTVYNADENFLNHYYGILAKALGLPDLYAVDYAMHYESRITGLGYAWDSLKNDFYRMILGFGPGSSFLGSALSTGAIHSIVKIPAVNQLAAILVDSGLVGACIYIAMLLYLLYIILKANRILIDRGERIIAAALAGIWFYYAIMGPFYDVVWRYDSSNYLFYFLLSFAYKRVHGKGASPGAVYPAGARP